MLVRIFLPVFIVFVKVCIEIVVKRVGAEVGGCDHYMTADTESVRFSVPKDEFLSNPTVLTESVVLSRS